MRSKSRRLIAVAIVLLVVLLVIPYVWITHSSHQKTLNAELIAAITHADPVAVDSLLAAGADPNARDTREARRSFWERLQFLMHPPKYDLSDTALIVALDRSHNEKYTDPRTTDIIRSLVSRGADVNVHDHLGLIETRAELDDPKSISEAESWIKSGAIPSRATPLMHAIANDDPSCVQLLISLGANIEDRDSTGDTALTAACTYCRPDVVRLLLAAGADANTRDDAGYTPMWSARAHRCPEIEKILKSHGAKE